MFSPQPLVPLILIVAVITAGGFAVTGCGGSSHDWKEEFTAQVEQTIESTKQVGAATRSATGPSDLKVPYGRYSEELLLAKEKLEDLESAPRACAEAEKHALGQVRRLRFASQGIANPKNYTPAELKNAKADPGETVEKLERDLSEARC